MFLHLWGHSPMKKVRILVIFIISLLLCLFFYIYMFYSSSHSSTLGSYYGISKDKYWETSFEVSKANNDIILKGEVVCLNNKMMNKFSDEEISDNVITIYKSNGLSFGGNYINTESNKFTLINYVKDDGYPYNRMVIAIGKDKIELKISKNK